MLVPQPWSDDQSAPPARGLPVVFPYVGWLRSDGIRCRTCSEHVWRATMRAPAGGGEPSARSLREPSLFAQSRAVLPPARSQRPSYRRSVVSGRCVGLHALAGFPGWNSAPILLRCPSVSGRGQRCVAPIGSLASKRARHLRGVSRLADKRHRVRNHAGLHEVAKVLVLIERPAVEDRIDNLGRHVR